MMKQKIKWGILAPGRIAQVFCQDLILSQQSEIVSVASRDMRRAEEFAARYNAKEIFDSYDEFYQKSSCDVVYIASPHVFHKQQAIACMNAGKSVLCEKPVAINAAEMQEIIDVAKKNNVFFMEAMWTCFFPLLHEVLALIDSGKLGQLSLIKADFCFRAEPDFQNRLYNPQLGGGSLLDTGVIVLSLAQMFMRQMPQRISSQQVMTSTGVDGSGLYILGYDNNRQALLSSSILNNTPNNATICCEEGYILIEDFWSPRTAVIKWNDGTTATLSCSVKGTGFYYEIKEVERCIAAGLTESQYRTWQDSLDMLTIVDNIRLQWSENISIN